MGKSHEQIDTKEQLSVKEPDMFRVIMLNDDYTTKEFVIEILMRIFLKDAAEATRIMMDVHKNGLGMVGVYSYDIASSKIRQVWEEARKREFPLQCRLERA